MARSFSLEMTAESVTRIDQRRQADNGYLRALCMIEILQEREEIHEKP